MSLALADTSAWILAVQRKEPGVLARIKESAARGELAVCPIVLLEWLAGRGKGEDPAAIRSRFTVLKMLPCTDAVWRRAQDLAAQARTRGHTVGAADALVAAHAMEAGAVLLHADRDFERLAPWSGLLQESLLRSR